MYVDRSVYHSVVRYLALYNNNNNLYSYSGYTYR